MQSYRHLRKNSAMPYDNPKLINYGNTFIQFWKLKNLKNHEFFFFCGNFKKVLKRKYQKRKNMTDTYELEITFPTGNYWFQWIVCVTEFTNELGAEFGLQNHKGLIWAFICKNKKVVIGSIKYYTFLRLIYNLPNYLRSFVA